MKKKLLPLMLASALIALAAPTFAQGKLIANGALVPVGETVVLTNEGPLIHTTFAGEKKCNSVVVKGHVIYNASNYAEIISDSTTYSGCDATYYSMDFGKPLGIGVTGGENKAALKGSYSWFCAQTGSMLFNWSEGGNVLGGHPLVPGSRGGGEFNGGWCGMTRMEVRFALTLENGTPVQIFK